VLVWEIYLPIFSGFVESLPASPLFHRRDRLGVSIPTTHQTTPCDWPRQKSRHHPMQKSAAKTEKKTFLRNQISAKRKENASEQRGVPVRAVSVWQRR